MINDTAQGAPKRRSRARSLLSTLRDPSMPTLDAEGLAFPAEEGRTPLQLPAYGECRLRLKGDNGKPNDNMLMHILSPYPQHRSALTTASSSVAPVSAAKRS